LAAAAGLASIAERWPPRRPRIVAALTAVLVLPSTIKTTRVLFHVEPRSDFRTAFEYVHDRLQPGDALWVSHPEVYQVYFDQQPTPLTPYLPLEQTQQVARLNRLWMIFTPQRPDRSSYRDVFDAVAAAGATRIYQHDLRGVEIALYAPRNAVQ
jgi:hypothetical protein